MEFILIKKSSKLYKIRITHFSMFNKRGIESETSHITGLIILIAILIVIYMLLIPPEAQREILEKGKISDNYLDSTKSDEKIKTLLLEYPGSIFPESNKEEQIKLPSINLFSVTSQKVISLGNSVIISRSLFNNNYQDLSFKIEDLSNIKNLKLFFNAVSLKGDLIVYINNQVIFKGLISNQDLPLEIPSSLIKNENIIRFESSSPSWRFLSINKYNLKDVKIIQDSTSENKKEIRRFNIEKENINKANLNYFINCININKEQGLLKLFLNNFNLHFGQVICDANQQSLDISKNYLINGENILSFEADKGNYILEQIELIVKTDEAKVPTYFFDAKENELNNEIFLRMDLIPNIDDERSSATIIINDERITLDTEKNLFSKDISSLIKEGENFIKIIPRNKFEIKSLEIFSK